ncbi:hypothetical protein MYCTH_2313751 [Thermothelomyces thermophilus ATCC 42464]|uniref:Uncharacterized protein n=1 Tax=Thermothelomyces thermophilus (strain ATCC 42464 / BCRC 31852 / DSM 1799) TaxID=573729 RepID=G2Q2F1_THET4|nr:uncharacterized protein MYCTH_2313751 [Thermothelomyces thermophilus ATCC 42464]AEO54276.1 hypothetical protein MYCTH_2313751 [Thermothelomyces thermophilus ATCC 42464]
MSIARAFTTRRVKQSIEAAERAAPHRSQSTREPASTLRHKISSPVELIHTTNMLSYNAPDIHPMSASSTGSLQRSDDDMSDGALTSGTTPPTSPEVESPSKKSASPKPNHLSSFFAVAPAQHTGAPTAQPEAPVIPQRAASHSNKQHKTLVRQRSASALSQQSHRTVSTKASFSFSRSSSTSTSTSVSSTPMHHHTKPNLSGSSSPAPASSSSFDPPSPRRQQPQASQHSQRNSSRRDYPSDRDNHPFGNELAQVSELAEEYGVKDQVVSRAEDLEEQDMARKGLLKFSADEYLCEVRGLFARFIVAPRPVAAAWI